MLTIVLALHRHRAAQALEASKSAGSEAAHRGSRYPAQGDGGRKRQVRTRAYRRADEFTIRGRDLRRSSPMFHDISMYLATSQEITGHDWDDPETAYILPKAEEPAFVTMNVKEKSPYSFFPCRPKRYAAKQDRALALFRPPARAMASVFSDTNRTTDLNCDSLSFSWFSPFKLARPINS